MEPERPAGTETVVLTLQVRQEDDYWAGECVELGTATDGPSADAVIEELQELVTIHLNGLDDIGERERVFRERGIAVYRTPPERMAVGSVPVSLKTSVRVQLQAWPLPPAEEAQERLAAAVSG